MGGISSSRVAVGVLVLLGASACRDLTPSISQNGHMLAGRTGSTVVTASEARAGRVNARSADLRPMERQFERLVVDFNIFGTASLSVTNTTSVYRFNGTPRSPGGVAIPVIVSPFSLFNQTVDSFRAQYADMCTRPLLWGTSFPAYGVSPRTACTSAATCGGGRRVCRGGFCETCDPMEISMEGLIRDVFLDGLSIRTTPGITASWEPSVGIYPESCGLNATAVTAVASCSRPGGTIAAPFTQRCTSNAECRDGGVCRVVGARGAACTVGATGGAPGSCPPNFACLPDPRRTTGQCVWARYCDDVGSRTDECVDLPRGPGNDAVVDLALASGFNARCSTGRTRSGDLSRVPRGVCEALINTNCAVNENLRWPTTGPATTPPVLSVRFPLDIDPDPNDAIGALLEIFSPNGAVLDLRTQVLDCGGAPCPGEGVNRFPGYRGASPLGDAVVPTVGLQTLTRLRLDSLDLRVAESPFCRDVLLGGPFGLCTLIAEVFVGSARGALTSAVSRIGGLLIQFANLNVGTDLCSAALGGNATACGNLFRSLLCQGTTTGSLCSVDGGAVLGASQAATGLILPPSAVVVGVGDGIAGTSGLTPVGPAFGPGGGLANGLVAAFSGNEPGVSGRSEESGGIVGVSVDPDAAIAACATPAVAATCATPTPPGVTPNAACPFCVYCATCTGGPCTTLCTRPTCGPGTACPLGSTCTAAGRCAGPMQFVVNDLVPNSTAAIYNTTSLGPTLDSLTALTLELNAVITRPFTASGRSLMVRDSYICPGDPRCLGAEGAVFEITDLDRDLDGDLDSVDNCPDDPNPAQSNRDLDAFGDICDLCPETPTPTNLLEHCDCDADRDGCNNASDFISCAATFGDGFFDERARFSDRSAGCSADARIDIGTTCGLRGDCGEYARCDTATNRCFVCPAFDLDRDGRSPDCDPDDDGDTVLDDGAADGRETYSPCETGAVAGACVALGGRCTGAEQCCGGSNCGPPTGRACSGSLDCDLGAFCIDGFCGGPRRRCVACDDNCISVPNGPAEDAQGDVNLDGIGDACSILCDVPDPPPICGLVAEGGTFDTARGGFGASAIDACLVDGPGCFGPAILTLPCDRFGNCDFGLPTLDVWNAGLTISTSIAFAQPPGASPDFGDVVIIDIPDRNYDGVNDWAIGSPGPECSGPNCLKGIVLLISGASGTEIGRIDLGTPGSRFGTSLARFGNRLLIGAPDMARSDGIKSGAVISVDLLRTDRAVDVWYGTQDEEKFGTALARVPATATAEVGVVVGAPGFDGSSGTDSGAAYAYELTGVLVERFDGPEGGARIGTSAATILPRKQIAGGIFIGAPDAGGGAGLVAFYGLDGSLRNIIRGAPGDRLGATIAAAADFDGDGVEEVAAAAPNANGGAGAVLVISSFGSITDRLDGAPGDRFGTTLAAPGDIDGDGLTDLLVGMPGRVAFGEERVGMWAMLSGMGGTPNTPGDPIGAPF